MQEYVVVLLRNGRCKAEARKELNVFLGMKLFLLCLGNPVFHV